MMENEEWRMYDVLISNFLVLSHILHSPFSILHSPFSESVPDFFEGDRCGRPQGGAG